MITKESENMGDCSRKTEVVRRRLTLLSGFVDNLCFSGLVYGWASLVFVLKTDGYFADRCLNVTLVDNSSTIDCSDQDEQFSMVMTIASFSGNLLRLPLGYAFDHFGTTVIRLLATTMYIGGTLLIALSTPDQSVMLFPATSCLLISGMLFYTSNAQVGNLFEDHRSTVINIYTGAFNSSAAVLLIVKLLHKRGFSLRTSFLFLSCGSIMFLLSTFFLMPRGLIPYPLPADYRYGMSCPCQGPGRTDHVELEERREGGDKDKSKIKYEPDERVEEERSSLRGQKDHLLLLQKELEEVPSFRSCVLSFLFLWHLLWMAIIQFCQVLFLSTCNSTLNRLASNDLNQVSLYTDVYAYIQLCGVLCSPCNGFILDRHKLKAPAQGNCRQVRDLRSFPLSLGLTSLQCFLFCVCFSVPVLPLQCLTFILQIINSSFLYGGHQAFISTAFPACHFGKLSGMTTSTSAVMLLLQIPLPQFIKQQLQGDPLYVNVGVAILSLLTFIHPIHVHLHYRKQLRQSREGGQGSDNDRVKI